MSRDQELERQLRDAADRFQAAFPRKPDLVHLITRGVDRQPDPRSMRARRLTAELALTALLVLIAAGVGIGIARSHGNPPAPSQVGASVTPSPSPSQQAVLPQANLDAAGLTNVGGLVTPLNQRGRNGGTGITLIGAYAEPARVVLFFRLPPGASLPEPSVYDAYGFLNGATSGQSAVGGDTFFGLDIGPRTSADGLAHLSVVMGPAPDFKGLPPAADVAFAVTVHVQKATPLPGSRRFPAGSWMVAVEKLEATPSVIHLQAVIAGATPDAIAESTVTLVDQSGQSLRQVAQMAGVTVPKQQLNNSNYANTRINDEWMRPAAAGTYRLRIEGPGGTAILYLDLGPI